MYIKLLILRKTKSYAKIATSFPAKVACKMCSFQMKHFSTQSVREFFANSSNFISAKGNFLNLSQYFSMYGIYLNIVSVFLLLYVYLFFFFSKNIII